ncbi:uncharacterized protein SCHCODRAFT_01347266, partial [Schizophyllum commune H4-8]|uniref:uncharacterized protein n=1 Tax=Schizophyllum commune (strain H4-8 / FGSC 9210) TaxID=578458 RepID=UPI002160C4A8
LLASPLFISSSPTPPRILLVPAQLPSSYHCSPPNPLGEACPRTPSICAYTTHTFHTSLWAEVVWAWCALYAPAKGRGVAISMCWHSQWPIERDARRTEGTLRGVPRVSSSAEPRRKGEAAREGGGKAPTAWQPIARRGLGRWRHSGKNAIGSSLVTHYASGASSRALRHGLRANWGRGGGFARRRLLR